LEEFIKSTGRFPELASPVPRSWATQYSSTKRNYSETVTIKHQREKVQYSGTSSIYCNL
jgi:DNA-binding sugar fermentation-stimulating protein